MRRFTKIFAFMFASFLAGILLSPGAVRAQVTMQDYTASPMILSGVSTPNILIIMDASGSMDDLANEDINSGDWDKTLEFSGMFDSLKCYTYDSANKRFKVGPTKAGLTSICNLGGGEWDGNFLNWGTLRRFDAGVLALTGGTCINTVTNSIGNRDAQGNCLASGTPAKKTTTLLNRFHLGKNGYVSTTAIPDNDWTERMPTSVTAGAGTQNLYFHVRGEGAMEGGFCVSTNSSDPSSSATDCDTGEAFNEQLFWMRLEHDNEPKGVLQEVGDKARFGVMSYSNVQPGALLTGVGLRQSIDQDISSSTLESFNTNLAAMLDSIDEMAIEGGTPGVPALYEGMRYLAQIGEVTTDSFHLLGFTPAANLGNAGTGSYGPGEETVLSGAEVCPAGYKTGACGRDPYFFGSNHSPPWSSVSARVECCKSYIILFTDGKNDDQMSATHTNIKNLTYPTVCCGIDPDEFNLAKVAYWGHMNDLRASTINVIGESGEDIPGTQNVTVYTFFAFGNALSSAALKETAKYGGFDDLNGNGIVDGPAEYDIVDNLTGAAGADGVPDTYYESKNAKDMKDKLTATIGSIIGRSKSGTAAAVQASSSTGEGAVYQAYFFPSTIEGLREVKWTGYLQSFFVDTFGNLREDSNGDGRLIYADDKIVEARTDVISGEVVVDRFVDVSPADGKKDSATPTDSVDISVVKPIWEAGKELALRNEGANPRKILTWVDKDNDGAVDATEQIAFTTANSATLAPYLRAGAAPYTATNIINFIRGAQVTGMRDRHLTVGGTPNTVWRLGDSVNSSPTVVGAPAERYDVIYGDPSYTDYFIKYKKRRHVIYMGANDGMLHAFNAGYYHKGDDPGVLSPKEEHGYFTTAPNDNSSGAKRGEELWGFIPHELLPHLQWLTRQDYSHVYYVDLKPKITDARIFNADATHPNGWGTILIGGFRLGGSCGDCTAGNAPPMQVTDDFGSGVETRTFYTAYFVLDITDPEQDPKMLYSFSDADLGLSTNFPAVVRASINTTASDNANAKWFFVTGSGPNGYHGQGAGGAGNEAKLVSLEMTKPWALGNTLTVRDYVSSDQKAIFTGLISLDKDLDYRADVLYVGNNKNVAIPPQPVWQGIAYRLTTDGGEPNTALWGVNKSGARQPSKILETFSCWPKPCAGTIKVGPISAPPTVTKDDGGNFWVFFGTGRVWVSTDRSNSEPQYFMGLKDPVMSGGCTESNVNNCEQNNLVKVTSAVVCIICDTGVDQVTGITGVTKLEGTATDTLQGLIASKDGWYTELPKARERVLFSPTLLAGIVWFPTFAPTANVCDSSGEAELYALFYLTGSAYSQSVIGTETVGANTNVKKSLALGSGIASQAAVHLGAVGTDPGTGVTGRMKACVQTSSGAVSCSRAKGALSSWSHYMSWISQEI